MRSRFSSTVLFTVFSKNSFETCAFRSLSVFPLAGEHANTRKHWFHGISFEEKLEVDPNLTQWELNEENKVTVGQTLFLIFLTMFIILCCTCHSYKFCPSRNIFAENWFNQRWICISRYKILIRYKIRYSFHNPRKYQKNNICDIFRGDDMGEANSRVKPSRRYI